MPAIQIKRGTRAQIDAAAAAGQLAPGEPYLITDEGRIATGTSASTYAAAAKQGESGSGGLTGGVIDGGNATTTYAGVPAFDFGSSA